VGQGISEVLTFAVGVAISPVPIIAVILMLFSQRARVNGPLFLLGWVLALAIAFVKTPVIMVTQKMPMSRSARPTLRHLPGSGGCGRAAERGMIGESTFLGARGRCR
jgi:Sap, sulfolipid-1-addressing protein